MNEHGFDGEYLSVHEAAEYLNVSTQTLRRWDASGKLKPVRHPVNGYRYYRHTDLAPFRLEYERAVMQSVATEHLFQIAVSNIEENERLREPQCQAHRAAREHFLSQDTPAILQIPVGCGKTGLIATLPFGLAKGRVLVITPNLTIRKGVADALDIASSKCFWTKTRVLTNFTEGPFCAILDGYDANIHDCTESHFVVTNIQQLASSADRWLPQFPRNFFDMIIVDEGHHNAAESWRKVFERFPEAKVISLTATPFRSDEKPLEGDIIYRYPFTRAMIKGYIKEIRSVTVAPAEIYFTFRNDERRHTLEEVLKLREEQWFRKGVALAPECNRHIVEASIQHCRSLRERTGMRHQVIAAACSVDHARQVRSIYEECSYRAKEIHSHMSEDERDDVLSDLRNGRLDCIVQVQMLGEGFDHPPLSVAAIFRPFRSLSPYIQFVGRIMRVIHENEPGHPDNRGIIVSHIGLNNDEQWDDFREIDIADQNIIHEWLTSAEEDRECEGDQSEGVHRRFDRGMKVKDEIISHFIDLPFLDPNDNRVIDRLLNDVMPGTGLTLRDLGVTAETLRAKLLAGLEEQKQVPQAIPISPQRRRVAVRKRVDERSGSVVNRILKELKLGFGGREISKVIAQGRGRANHIILIEQMNNAINDFMGIGPGERATVTAEQLQEAYNSLDLIGDGVRDMIKQAMEVEVA